MGRPVHPNIITPDSALGGKDITRSLRFEDSENVFLTRTPSTTGNRRTWTFSVWVKHNINGVLQTFFSSGTNNPDTIIKFTTSDQFEISRYGGSYQNQVTSSALLRDPCAWYHLVGAVDTTQSTSSNRVKLYINGTLVTDFANNSYPSQNYEYPEMNNSGTPVYIGRHGHPTTQNFDGYMAEFNFIDGAQLTPDNFGYTEPQTGIWKPKKFKSSSNIPNRKGRNFSSTWTASGNGFGSYPITRAYDGDISTNANNSAGGQILTWNTSTYNLSGNLRIYGRGDAYDVYVNGNATKVADMPSSNGWVDCGTHTEINEIQFAGTTYNTNNGLGSAGIHLNSFIVGGVWLRDDFPTFGTNGFYLDFSDNSATTAVTLGKDRSGNGNDFTPNNFSVAAGEGNDSSLDTPTNNLCTLNPLERFTHNCTLSNGNLKATGPNESYPGSAANIALSSGKWYYEFVINTKTSNPMCGVCQNNYVSGGAGRILYRSTGHYVLSDGSEPSDPDTFAVGDIIGVAIDLDDTAGNIRFYKNGTLQTVNGNLNSIKSQMSISTLGGLHPYIQMYHNDVCTVNFGQRPFSYTPPSGHKKLTPNTNNNSLDYSTPSILDPKEHFKTLVWTGNRTNNRVITGLEFQPDLVWIKKRNVSIMSHFFISSAQTYTSSGSGNGNVGAFVSGTNATDAEGTTTDGGFVSFNKDGFTLGKGSDDSNDDSAYQRMNANSAGYVAWCWKAGNTYASNSDGTITSSVSANTEAGFSIVSYTGNETNNATVGHGLSKSPDMIIIKDRDTNSAGNNWYIFNSGLASGHYLKLNQNSATAALSGTSNGGVGSVTSTTFNFIQGTAGNNKNTNENGDRFIAYCWHSVPGYSKIGSFKGNANANGPFVYTGFRPAFILFKNSSTTTNWELYDTTRPYSINGNPVSRNLYANTSGQEETHATLPLLDILSNGFKPRSTWDEFNKSNDTILYMAFAEQPGGITPFQTSANAR